MTKAPRWTREELERAGQLMQNLTLAEAASALGRSSYALGYALWRYRTGRMRFKHNASAERTEALIALVKGGMLVKQAAHELGMTPHSAYDRLHRAGYSQREQHAGPTPTNPRG